MSVYLPLRRLAAAAVALLVLGGAARAQQTRLQDEGSLNKLYDSSRNDWNSLRKRERTFDEKKDGEMLAKIARFHVMRVAVFTRTAQPKALYEVVEDFRNLIGEAVAARKKGTEPDEAHARLVAILGSELVKNFRNLFKLEAKDFGDGKRYRMMLVHASLMLEPLGRLGSKEVGDFLVGLVKDNPNDLLRLYALKGLQNNYQARRPEVFDFTSDQEREATAARLAPVVDLLTRPTKIAPTASVEEKGAARFLRREAVKALAEARLNSVPLLDGKTLKAPVAFALLRVLAPDKDMAPPPLLSEKIEAAIGLCEMKSEIKANSTTVIKCQPDLVVGLVGKTVLELVQQYQHDHPNFATKGSGRVPALAWRYQARRVRLALADLQANLPQKADARKNAQALEKASLPLFTLMEGHKALDSLQPLLDVMKGLPRPTALPYEGHEDYRIEVGAWPPIEG
jgi:hypothetical protein